MIRSDKVTELEKLLSERDSLISELQEKIYNEHIQLEDLRNSKIIKLAISIRSILGKIVRSPKTVLGIFKKLIHGIRVIGAPVVPTKVRKLIKNAYRDMTTSTPEIIEIDNHRWPLDLPLVSVVIPYFNAHKTIMLTLNSLNNQSFRSLEIILVDDRSTAKETDKILKEINYKHKDIKIIRKEINEGVAQARNTGMSMARGKYILCLDADDWIDPTYIEKCVAILETNPNVDFVTPYTELFGVKTGIVRYAEFNALELMKNNMIIHAAVMRRTIYDSGISYKSGIGYEDWEFWIESVEKGYFGHTIHEKLFNYRTSISSRFVDDRSVHGHNVKIIKNLHPSYRKKVLKHIREKRRLAKQISKATALINIKGRCHKEEVKKLPSILIAMPWMTFGGAETLIYNFVHELGTEYDVTFVTGLKSNNEWEWRFRQLTESFYHLPNILDNPELFAEYLSLIIDEHNIDILHIVHNGFVFPMLDFLKDNHKDLKVVCTMFNDRVEYFEESIKHASMINSYTTDNSKVSERYKELLGKYSGKISTIPNGIDVEDRFNRSLYDLTSITQKYSLNKNKTKVVFVGRFSEEKNPDVFARVAVHFSEIKQGNSLEFYMIGDGPMMHVIQAIVKGHSNIHLLGYRNPETEVPEILSASDIFILPSKIEGFPLTIIEAMATCNAIIASDVGAMRDVIETGTNGFIVRPGSEKEIIERLNDLITDKKKISTLGSNARKKAQEMYSLEKLGANYKRMYRELL